MSHVEPPRPDPEDSAIADSPFPYATWGVRGAIFGMLVAFLAVVAVALVIVTIARSLGVEVASPTVSLTLTVAGFAVFVAVAFFVARGAGGGWWHLGFRAPALQPALRAIPVGGLLVGVSFGYAGLLSWLDPAAYEAMMREVESQRAALDAPWPLLFLLAVVAAPLAEEIFFRGLIHAGLRTRISFAYASSISALLFALGHGMLWSLIPLFVIGLASAWVYEREKSLASPIALHATYNAVSLVASLFVDP